MCEGSDCRWSEVRNGKDNCPFSSSPGNLRVATGISCFLSLTGLLSLMLSISVACALAETGNALILCQYCQWSVLQHQRNLESTVGFEADSPSAALVCYAADLCAWDLRRQMMAWRCNLNPETCSCWLLRLWNGTGSQLTLQAFVAVFWHLTACLDGSCLQHRARQGNEWINWQIFRYIRFLLTIVSFQTVNTPKCHMLLNRQIQYTP